MKDGEANQEVRKPGDAGKEGPAALVPLGPTARGEPSPCQACFSSTRTPGHRSQPTRKVRFGATPKPARLEACATSLRLRLAA